VPEHRKPVADRSAPDVANRKRKWKESKHDWSLPSCGFRVASEQFCSDLARDCSQYTCAKTHPSKWEKIICQRKPQSITRKHQSILRIARHHGEAAKHHEAGSHEKAAHHAHVARGHVIHSRGHAEEAVKAHLEEHGKK
jgi:hypothetical protein